MSIIFPAWKQPVLLPLFGLALLSVGELSERVALLKDEIARLEAEMKRKNASKSAADMFFKK